MLDQELIRKAKDFEAALNKTAFHFNVHNIWDDLDFSNPSISNNILKRKVERISQIYQEVTHDRMASIAEYLKNFGTRAFGFEWLDLLHFQIPETTPILEGVDEWFTSASSDDYFIMRASSCKTFRREFDKRVNKTLDPIIKAEDSKWLRLSLDSYSKKIGSYQSRMFLWQFFSPFKNFVCFFQVKPQFKSLVDQKLRMTF